MPVLVSARMTGKGRHPGSLLLRSSRRYLLRHPWQTWLSIIGIALGVAVVIAVDLANDSARRAFALSIQQVTGPATHSIESADGSIDQSEYVRLRVAQGLRPAVPVIDAPVRLNERSMTLLGLDPLAALDLRKDLARGLNADPNALPDLISRPDTILLSSTDAAELGAVPGDILLLETNPREAPNSVELVGLIAADQGNFDGLILTDIASAQELLGRVGQLDRIDLILTDQQAKDLDETLAPGLRLRASAQRANALMQMTRAFHTNLTAMSLLALLVGAFIVYNSMTFAVLQRRPLLGSFRMLGVTRGQLFGLVLIEASVLALIGALIGVLLGILVGAGLVQLVTRTINDVYFQLNLSGLHLSLGSVLKGIGLGIGVTLIAALGPAAEAARSQPRDVLRQTRIETRGQRLLPWLALIGALLILTGLGLVQWSSRSMGLGFIALFLVILGASLIIPLLLSLLARASTPLFGALFGITGRLAARGISASITRSGLAVAALSVAVAASLGVGVMISSFRASVIDWLDHTLTSDLYIATSIEGAPTGAASLPQDLPDRLTALPEVALLSLARNREVQTREGVTRMLALQFSQGDPRGFRFEGPTLPDLWSDWRSGETILISQPFAYRQQLKVGDRLDLFTSQGWQTFRIGAIFRDYGSDSGTLVLPLEHYARLWGDPGISSIGLVLKSGVDAEALSGQIQELLHRLDIPASVQTNSGIRELSLRIFDQSFTITEVLRLLAIGVAFVGILSALMALELERARDYAVLRATGLSRLQLARLILLQTSGMGLAAGLFAIPLGLMMGQMLIEVINLRSFGWSMPMQVPPTTPVGGLLLGWLAALLAGLYPALRAARATPARALRRE